MQQIDSSETVAVGDEVVTAGIELGGGVRSPYPEGPAHRPGRRRRSATRTTSSRPPILQPAADLDKLEYLLVITDYQGGLPPIEQQPVDCGDGRRPARRASSRASRRARRPTPDARADGQALTLGGRCRPVATATLPGDEGHRARRRDRDPALPADDRHQQAPAADLRPADDLLPDRDARRDGHPRGDGHRRRQERRRRRRAARRRLATSGST